MAISGIAAKFSGTCPLCSRNYGEGEFITKISDSPEEKKRGHVACVAKLKDQSAALSSLSQHPTATPVSHSNVAGRILALNKLRQGLSAAVDAIEDLIKLENA